jgi:hypothetical protein
MFEATARSVKYGSHAILSVIRYGDLSGRFIFLNVILDTLRCNSANDLVSRCRDKRSNPERGGAKNKAQSKAAAHDNENAIRDNNKKWAGNKRRLKLSSRYVVDSFYVIGHRSVARRYTRGGILRRLAESTFTQKSFNGFATLSANAWLSISSQSKYDVGDRICGLSKKFRN